MVSREQPHGSNEPLGIRDVLAQMNQRIDDLNLRIDDLNLRIGDLNQRIDDLNQRISDLREDVNARFRLLTWGIAIGFAAILSILGALLARGG